MRNSYRKIFAAVLSATFMFSSVLGANQSAVVAKAVETGNIKTAEETFENLKENTLVGIFPVGARLETDSFPGMTVLYNDKKTYTIVNGANFVELKVHIIDEKLAKTGIEAINSIFGPVSIKLHAGEVSSFKCRLNGVDATSYEKRVQNNKNAFLSAFLKGFIDESKKAESLKAEYEKFYKAVVEAIRLQEEEDRKAAAAVLPNTVYEELEAVNSADNTGKSVEQIEADCDRDYYLDSKECMEYGLVDKVFTGFE